MRIFEGFVGVEGALGLPTVSALSLLNGRGWVLHQVGTAGGGAHGDRRRDGFAAITHQVRVPIWMSHWQPKYIPGMPKLPVSERQAAAVFERNVPGARDSWWPPREQLRAKVVCGVVGLGTLVVLAWTAGHHALRDEDANSRLDVVMQPRINGNAPSRNEGAPAGRKHEDSTPLANAPDFGFTSPPITAVNREQIASVGTGPHGSDAHVRMAEIPAQQSTRPHSPAKVKRQLVPRHSLGHARDMGRLSSDSTLDSGARHLPAGTGRAQERRTARFDARSDAREKNQEKWATSRLVSVAKPVDATSAIRTDSAATGWMEYMKQRRLTEVPQEFSK